MGEEEKQIKLNQGESVEETVAELTTRNNHIDKVKEAEMGLLDGGFAVVDREQLIEEETRVVTPWYKYFLRTLYAPQNVVEENLLLDPPRGASHGVVGTFVYTIITILLSFMNPVMKQSLYDSFRASGTDEAMLSQKYTMQMATSVIGGVIGVFAIIFIITFVLQIIKAIAGDKCKFSTLYTMVLMTNLIALFIGMIEAIAQIAIGVTNPIFSLYGFINPETLMYNRTLSLFINNFTLGKILSVIYMIIGYKTLTHNKWLKSSIVCLAATAIIMGVPILFS